MTSMIYRTRREIVSESIAAIIACYRHGGAVKNVLRQLDTIVQAQCVRATLAARPDTSMDDASELAIFSNCQLRIPGGVLNITHARPGVVLLRLSTPIEGFSRLFVQEVLAAMTPRARAVANSRTGSVTAELHLVVVDDATLGTLERLMNEMIQHRAEQLCNR